MRTVSLSLFSSSTHPNTPNCTECASAGSESNEMEWIGIGIYQLYIYKAEKEFTSECIFNEHCKIAQVI